MKRIRIILIISTVIGLSYLVSCKPAMKIVSKSGAQIWGETCIRCHNGASPQTFSDVEWDVATMHMQLRANLTRKESIKVLEFLKSAN